MSLSRALSRKNVGVGESRASLGRTRSNQEYQLVAIEEPSDTEAVTSASEAETSFNGEAGRAGKDRNNINVNVYKIQNLSAVELKAFKNVKDGALEDLKATLESKEYIEQGDINNTDKCGFALLHYAVIHQYEPIVEFLLTQENIFLFDTLYYAITEENTDIVKAINTFRNANSARLENTPMRDSDFPKSLTPLMLACKLGNLELIELFYKGGDRLSWCKEGDTRTSMYHDECFCNMCIGSKSLVDDYERLSLWQAFCNPVYISFISGEKKDFDPVQEAFFLIKLLKEQVLPIEQIFTKEYLELVEKLEQFTVDMLDICCNSYETELMLMAERDNKECSEKYPRLRWALDLNNVNFVVHSHTQSVLYKWWAGEGWPSWIGMHPMLKFLHFLSRFILFVPVSILLLFDRESSLGRFFSTPVNIFLNSMASYFVFLIVLTVQVTYRYQRCNTPGNYVVDADCNLKGSPRIGTEWVIILYVLGFLLNSIKHFWPKKKGFFKYRWNVYNLAGQISFIIAFIFWGLSYLERRNNLIITNGVDPELPRFMWKAMDPILIAEAFMALGTMISVGRVLQYVQVDPHLGPLQTGLGLVINRFVTTGIYFIFVLFAFAAGLTGNYKAYVTMKDEHGNEVATKVKDDFAYFFGATKSLFFGLYGILNREAMVIELDDIVLANGTTIPQHHYINQLTGEIMAIAFHVFGLLMLMSVLTAFLFNAFEETYKDQMKTWKYARTEVYLFFGLETAIPSPMNLLIFLNMYYYTKCGKKSVIASHCSSKFCCYYQGRESKAEGKKRRIQYFILMNKFRLKYIEKVKKRNNEEPATADDVKEINEELGQLKDLMQKKGLVPLEEPEEKSKSKTSSPGPSSSSVVTTVPKPDLSTASAVPTTSGPMTVAEAIPNKASNVSGTESVTPKPLASTVTVEAIPNKPSNVSGTKSVTPKPATSAVTVEAIPNEASNVIGTKSVTPKPAASSKSATVASTPPSKPELTPPFVTPLQTPLSNIQKSKIQAIPLIQTPTPSKAQPIAMQSKTVTPSKLAPFGTPSWIAASPTASAPKTPAKAAPSKSASSKVEPSIVDIVPPAPALPPKGSSADVSSQPSAAPALSGATPSVPSPPPPSKTESKK